MFEDLVDQFYRPLYRFALSLSKNEDDASDLTQQTFFIWAKKGSQLKDSSKVKSWLFTTLYREFLAGRKRLNRYTSIDLEQAEPELPIVQADPLRAIEAKNAIAALMRVEEIYRIPLTLFYQQSYTYLEIAEILDLPIGTVMSRLSRGKAKLKNLVSGEQVDELKLVPFRKPGGADQSNHESERVNRG